MKHPNIAIKTYRFYFKTQSAVRLPIFAGSAWRGALGHSLKKIVCVVRNMPCNLCLLKNACAYSIVFETPTPSNAEKMANSVLETLEKVNLTVDDIDLLVPHQANLRILNSVAARLKIPLEKVIITVENHANTSAASIPLALDFANKNHKIKKGDLIVLEALGGGLTWGSIAMRW